MKCNCTGCFLKKINSDFPKCCWKAIAAHLFQNLERILVSICRQSENATYNATSDWRTGSCRLSYSQLFDWQSNKQVLLKQFNNLCALFVPLLQTRGLSNVLSCSILVDVMSVWIFRRRVFHWQYFLGLLWLVCISIIWPTFPLGYTL